MGERMDHGGLKWAGRDRTRGCQSDCTISLFSVIVCTTKYHLMLLTANSSFRAS